MKNKLKVAVLFGGQSSEHDVSCMSCLLYTSEKVSGNFADQGIHEGAGGFEFAYERQRADGVWNI